MRPRKAGWRARREPLISQAMQAKIFFPAAAIIALLMIALSLVWP
jgi:hypothetical protein